MSNSEIELLNTAESSSNIRKPAASRTKRNHPVWEHFEFDEDRKLFYCKICPGKRQSFDYSSDNHPSTTVAKRHIEKVHPSLIKQSDNA